MLEDPGLAPNPNLANNARGIEIAEELPDTRSRAALFGKVRRFIKPGRSVELGGRIYSDSWGINSIAVEPRLYQSLSDDLLLRLRYRLYTQTEADDFSDEFLQAAGTPKERTQDSDLSDFNSNTFGARFDWNKSAGSSWSLGLDYILRSDGLDHFLIGIGWSKSF